MRLLSAVFCVAIFTGLVRSKAAGKRNVAARTWQRDPTHLEARDERASVAIQRRQMSAERLRGRYTLSGKGLFGRQAMCPACARFLHTLSHRYRADVLPLPACRLRPPGRARHRAPLYVLLQVRHDYANLADY